MSSVVSLGHLQKIFEKKLSETDTNHRLSLPSKSLPHFLNSNSSSSEPIEFRVLDVSGHPYKMLLKVRKEGYLKPEITGDWIRFIHAKNLKPCDIVMFFKHPAVNNASPKLIFTIVIKRAVKVFGENVVYTTEFIE